MQGILARDYPLVQGVMLIYGFAFVAINLTVDVALHASPIRVCAMTDIARRHRLAGTCAPRRRFVLLRRLPAHRSFQIGAVLLSLLTALAAILAPLHGHRSIRA